MRLHQPFFCFFFLVLAATTASLASAKRPPPQSFRIGSIFMENDHAVNQAFHLVTDMINKDNHYLNGTRMDANSLFTHLDPFEATNVICQEMSYSVIAVFGSSPSPVDSNIGSVCSALHIPYLTTSPSGVDGLPDPAFLVRLGPSQEEHIKAIADTVTGLGWKEVAYVSHRTSAVLDAQKLIAALQKRQVSVRLLDLQAGDNRMSIVEMRNRGINDFIVDVSPQYLQDFFDLCSKSGVLHSKSRFMSVSLDSLKMKEAGWSDMFYTGAEFFSVTSVDLDSVPALISSGQISTDWANRMVNDHRAALLYDGVHWFVRGIEAVIKNDTDLTIPSVTCSKKDEFYPLGATLLSTMSQVSYDGLTGQVSVTNGKRQGFVFNVVKMTKPGQFSTVGKWTSAAGLEVFRHKLAIPPELTFPAKTHLTVATIATDPIPYVLKSSSSSTTPSEVIFEGLLIDLLNLLSKDLDFTYSIKEHFKYGGLDSASGNWTGLIKSLIEQEADLGLADMTLTPERTRVIDFSPPFESFGATILAQTGSDEGSENGHGAALSLAGLTSYLNPFSLSMWILLVSAYFLTSLVVYMVGRLSPYERPANLSLADAFWTLLMGLLQKSSPSTPKAASSRLLVAFWWMFCLSILILYVASMGATLFRALQVQPRTPRTVDWFIDQDLAKLKTSSLGGSTASMLKHSKDPLQQELFKKIVESHASDASENKWMSTSSAVEAVVSDAMLGVVMEEPRAKFWSQSSCVLSHFGSFGMLHYSLAFAKGSTIRDKVSQQLLVYERDGTLDTLKAKWFVQKNKQNSCSGNMATMMSDTFSLTGPFVLLLVASITAVLMALIEVVYFSIRTSSRNRGPVGVVLRNELRKSVQCGDSHPDDVAVLPGANGNHSFLRSTSNTDPAAVLMMKGNGKNGHQFHQSQALLRKDGTHHDDLHSQL